MMPNFVKNTLLASLLFVAACGSSSAQDEAITNSCKDELKFSDSACACVLKETENLTDAQKSMLVLMISGDNAAVTQALSEGKASPQDMMTLTNFMTETPFKCENK